MELHLFIFLATKSVPASFQPFSHPSPGTGHPTDVPCCWPRQMGTLGSVPDAVALRLKLEHKNGTQISAPQYR